ncbi:MAG: heparinase II/III-family protein [Saprospiraceae bacterium]|nr:heparinase II/III-family protein [Saprospiraceae bacterium]MDP4913176.1 heparinase II/III-family protein [Saprospiraceae bacterium]
MRKYTVLPIEKIIIVCSFLVPIIFPAKAQDGRHILKQQYTVDFFKQHLQEATDWVPYPAISQSAAWKAVLSTVQHAKLIQQAEGLLGYQWPMTRASVFLDYAENGNRTNFEKISFSRRDALSTLVVGELLENKGRFMDEIVDGIWSICEESFWGVPAHLTYQKRGIGLPDVNDPVVDLFAAETSSLLAWVSHLMGDKLDKVNPMIKERIYIEIDRRIFKVIESDPKYRWMGYGRKNVDSTLSYKERSFLERRPNNWNPWISSNLLSSVLLLEKNKDRRAIFVHQVFDVLDNYLDPYPADGGCDEGPGYWGKAAASTFDCLDLVKMATNNKFNLFDEPLVKSMGEFIFKAYIGDGYYLNFADAVSKTNHSPMLIYRYGKAVGSSTMMEMGAYLAKKTPGGVNMPEGYSLLRKLPELFYSKELLIATSFEPLILGAWLPDIQVMVSRDQEASKKGLYIAAKAGHNQESHNHNDVGSFMIFFNGKPVLIDVGAGTYTKDYGKSWVISSSYHNMLPIVNGDVQLTGRKYAASNVSFTSHSQKNIFKQDISKTYNEELGMRKWERTITHNKGKSIVIADNFDFLTKMESIILPMMLVSKPDVTVPGKMVIKTGDAESITIGFDQQQFELTIEEINIQDAKISHTWGNTIYRAQFRMKNATSKGKFQFTIQ